MWGFLLRSSVDKESLVLRLQPVTAEDCGPRPLGTGECSQLHLVVYGVSQPELTKKNSGLR